MYLKYGWYWTVFIKICEDNCQDKISLYERFSYSRKIPQDVVLNLCADLAHIPHPFV